jgi:hypothetical protein
MAERFAPLHLDEPLEGTWLALQWTLPSEVPSSQLLARVAGQRHVPAQRRA